MGRASSVTVIQLALAATGFLINCFWELVQSPLYDDVKRGPSRGWVGTGHPTATVRESE